MATILDLKIGTFLAPLFIFILVFALLYAILTKINFFTKSKNVNAMLAFVVAVMFLFIPDLGKVLILSTPWAVLLLIITVLILLLFMSMGATGKTFESMVEHPTIMTVFIAGVILVFLIGITQVYGPVVFYPPEQQVGLWADIRRSIFSAKFLGAVFVIIIASYVGRYLVKFTD